MDDLKDRYRNGKVGDVEVKKNWPRLGAYWIRSGAARRGLAASSFEDPVQGRAVPAPSRWKRWRACAISEDFMPHDGPANGQIGRRRVPGEART
jgi:hypothetical protein